MKPLLLCPLCGVQFTGRSFLSALTQPADDVAVLRIAALGNATHTVVVFELFKKQKMYSRTDKQRCGEKNQGDKAYAHFSFPPLGFQPHHKSRL